MLSNPKFEVKTAKILYLYLLIISSPVTSLMAYYLMINSAINETAYYKYHNRINKTENSVGSFYFPWAINQALLLSSVTETGDDKRFAFSAAELKTQIRKQSEFFIILF